ncbi:MAG: peroxidase-related enzyme [Terracidiphilus sp.]
MDRLEYQLLAKLRTNPPPTSETKIKLIEEKDAQGDTALAYQYFRDQTGRRDVPGILKCFGTNPAFTRQMVDISSSLLFNEGHLSRRQKELIATWISQLNACPYCTDSHGFFLVAHGVAKETAQSLAAGNLDAAGLSESETQLLRYLEQVNKASFKTTRSDVLVLIASGWSEEQIAEAVHVAAMLAFCNTVANAFGLPSQNMMALLDSAAVPSAQGLSS